MQHHRQHGACMASVFWVGLGLSCGHGPGSGQLGSESVLSGVDLEAWMVPCCGTCRSLKTSLGPGEAQEAQLGNPAALFILVGVSSLAFSECISTKWRMLNPKIMKRISRNLGKD